MLLTLKPQQPPPPPGNFPKEDLYGRRRWRRVQYLADQFWPLARVTEVHPSQDGRVRKADVTVCRGGSRHTYLRPISELILIEKGPDHV